MQWPATSLEVLCGKCGGVIAPPDLDAFDRGAAMAAEVAESKTRLLEQGIGGVPTGAVVRYLAKTFDEIEALQRRALVFSRELERRGVTVG